MDTTFYYTVDFDSLVHHGIKGQKWGERRYQNKDGSLTAEGYKHWGVSPNGGNRLTSRGRGKNAVRVADAVAKREKQQKKLDKEVEKAKKSGDKERLALAKKSAKEFHDQGKGFVKSMNKSLKGTSSKDMEDYLKRSNDLRTTGKMLITSTGGLALATIATGGVASVGALGVLATGWGAGMVGGRVAGEVSARKRNKRVRNTVGSLKL